MPRKDTVARFSVSLPSSLLDELDLLVKRRGFHSRSQAVAALAREGLVEMKSEEGSGTMAGTINLVYDYRTRNLQTKLMAIQHKYYVMVVTSQHVHLEHHHYLEVLLVQGPVEDLRKLTDELSACKGVKYCKLQLAAEALPPLL
ncbi:nickel-responsive transcriptional regulator NikR [Synoicihabitans lomoniglobus]|uniref:Putative nickel-responsive regulator n=1 Tax=Synoicihabitans lomoniglobus TaxID=2909285 RepID=A0AAE9ZTJ2_9BACT|nr:nickel-responsive transcriptional regulator NikR [Opitutaceae bacterium LMO-M01]WED64905.1 nickel-responsive transcriptional regulator NikR [Opitutaceae bacterium LMO-M01]